MRSQRSLVALIALGLLLVSSVAAPIAAAQSTETATSTATSSDGRIATVMDVVDSGPAVSQERARVVYDYVAEEGTESLSEDQLRRIYRWMLRRSASSYVPEVVIDDVADALPSNTAERLADAYAPATSTPTATPEPTSSPTPAADSSSESSSSQNESGDGTVIERVDSVLVVSDYSYDAENETFTVQLTNTAEEGDDENASSVTITEVISRRQAGSGSFGIATVDIAAGETRSISISAKRNNGAAAVMVVSERSVESRTGTYLQESQKSSGGIIQADPTGAQVRSAALFSFGGAILFVILGAWQFVAARNTDVQDADLNPSLTLLGRFRRFRR